MILFYCRNEGKTRWFKIIKSLDGTEILECQKCKKKIGMPVIIKPIRKKV